MASILLKIITPEAQIHEEHVDQVTLPTTEGEITVLPGHVALVTLINKGEIVASAHGELIPFLVMGGFARIGNDEVSVMADVAEPMNAVATATAIEAAQQRAQELEKAHEHEEHVNFEHFEGALERALLTAKLGDKWKNRKYRK